ncbi:flagellin [Halorubrum sp. JWXQ-INN 858]|uniref:flagellin n=1 Tax=Halorubrum sp. JWXQ-INN 858 TaxID=2690782 RepID=UPI00135C82B9|nr:flagellin [Halorubrum sp. JWXQ-INN 858]MWV63685.1 flagellin [Halorubrum sp. JWXQ-INN 858]
MGVSVSASTAIIVAGLFFAFTTFYPVAGNGFERVTAAERDVHDRALDRQNTAIAIDDAAYHEDPDPGDGATEDEVVVAVVNDGATGLVVSDTTLVVDNGYVDLAAVDTTVVGDAEGDDPDGDTDLWLAGETLTVTLVDADVDGAVADADRVGVVTEPGVRDAATVTDAEVEA